MDTAESLPTLAILLLPPSAKVPLFLMPPGKFKLSPEPYMMRSATGSSSGLNMPI